MTNALLRLWIVLLGFLAPVLVPMASAAPQNPFSVVVKDAAVAPGGAGVLTVTVVVPDGHHVYRDMMAVEPAGAAPTGITLSPASFPPGLSKPDPASPGTMREVYEDDVLIDVPVAAAADASGVRPVTLLVRYQGCKKDLCFFPQEEQVTLNVNVSADAPSTGAATPAPVDGGEVAVVITGVAGAPGAATLKFDLQGDWHINKAFVSAGLPVDAEGKPAVTGWALGAPSLPPGETSGSEADGSAREDYVHDFEVVVPVTAAPPDATSLTLEVGYQACKGVSLCRLPAYETITVPFTPGGAPATNGAAEASADTSGGFGAAAAADGIGAVLLLCFLGGVGVSFTPCVLPMVPITMGLIGARNAGSRAQAVMLSGAYVLGLAVVYTVLGVFAGVTGALFGSWLQSPWIVGSIAAFFFVMGLAMFGLFDVGVPSGLASRLSGKGGGGSVGGAVVLGMVGAVLAGPCSGPVVASILALIGQDGQVATGALLMFAFSLGMGMIFLVTGAASGWLPQRGAWMAFVKKAFGVVMWLGAIFYAAPHLSTTVTALLTAAVMLGTGVFGWPDPEDGEGWVTVRVRQLWAIVGGIVGAYLLLGVLVREGFILPPVSLAGPSAGASAAQAEGIEWMSDEAAALARAQAENKPLVIDFTAEWCQACHELDRYTFSDVQVAGLARGQFIALRLDCTKGGDPAVKAVQQKYGVTGLPTVVFTRPDGTPVDKTIGFVEAAPFLAVMQKALAAVRG